MRATSLIEGQLRGPGFVSITRGDESTNIDIEGDGDNEDEDYGPSQFGESDLILPEPENIEEEEDLNSRINIQSVLEGERRDSDTNSSDSTPKASSARDNLEDALTEDNSKLREKSMCNICLNGFDMVRLITC